MKTVKDQTQKKNTGRCFPDCTGTARDRWLMGATSSPLPDASLCPADSVPGWSERSLAPWGGGSDGWPPAGLHRPRSPLPPLAEAGEPGTVAVAHPGRSPNRMSRRSAWVSLEVAVKTRGARPQPLLRRRLRRQLRLRLPRRPGTPLPFCPASNTGELAAQGDLAGWASSSSWAALLGPVVPPLVLPEPLHLKSRGPLLLPLEVPHPRQLPALVGCCGAGPGRAQLLERGAS